MKEKSPTLRWNTQHCYNPDCGKHSQYRCYHYERCGHGGCCEHMPLLPTKAGKIRLCGECRLLRALVFGENHLIGC